MKALDPDLIRERSQVLETHLARIGARMPKDVSEFKAGTDAADVVSLNLLCGIQIALDLSIFACIHFGLQAPSSYNDAVARLADAGRISEPLANRLEAAADLRDAFVHAFPEVDASSIYRAALYLPADLRMFMAELLGHLGG